jgi:hypothetical protein
MKSVETVTSEIPATISASESMEKEPQLIALAIMFFSPGMNTTVKL